MWCVYVMICLRIKKWELGLAFGYDQTFMSMIAPLMQRWADGGPWSFKTFGSGRIYKTRIKDSSALYFLFFNFAFSCDCMIH